MQSPGIGDALRFARMVLTPRQRLRSHYMLALLMLGFTLNSVDRSILSVLVEPIRREFGTTDTQIGLLTGLAFAVVYSLCGLPIATWADRGNRRNVLATGILFWSLMTAACGLAPAFLWLLFARMGVAAGEAAGTPVSHALIADLYPREQRATALSIYGIGAPAGVALAGLLGGHGIEWLGWRMTLMLAAIPGLVLASVLLLTTDEPPRHGITDAKQSAITWRAALGELWPSRVFRHLWVACALHSIALFSGNTFNTAYLMRTEGWSASSAGELIGMVGAAGAAGTFAGGWLADQLARRTGDRRWVLRIAGLTTLATVPFQCLAYLLPDVASLSVMLTLTGLFGYGFLGPAYAAAQAEAKPHARARVAALLVLAITIVGMGVGPLLTGVLSDALLPTAGNEALRYALLLAPAMNLWSAVHLFIAARR
jgi:predicted MFS family arabinose efflux permease